ncbi:MAG: phosphoribosylformylglycinamidine cyclo-ligase [Thermoleophilia bacterium]
MAKNRDDKEGTAAPGTESKAGSATGPVETGQACGPAGLVSGLSYRDAGVDIEAGEEAVRLMKAHAESTRIPGVLGTLGGFAALYELPDGLSNPVVVTATDGVGTKLLIAQQVGKLNTVGIDLVAMCANDILAVGGSPLLFLDYLAVGRLVPEEAAEIVAGIAEGCRRAGCALVGGETAEMPGLYEETEFDLAGFCVGLAEKDRLVDGSGVQPGDIVIGLASDGLHANGFSLARKILEANQCSVEDKFPHFGESIAHTLLKPTRIYVDAIWTVLGKGVPVRAMAHITGGGIGGNLSRVIPEGLSARLHFDNWKIPKVFRALQELGEVEDEEMFRAFNMGVGFVLVVPLEAAEYAAKLLIRAGEDPFYLGSIVAGEDERRVTLEGVF